jgi:membrane protein implicated in regulation of membrane protease activity
MNNSNLSRGGWFSMLVTRLLIGIVLAIPAGFLVMFLWNTIVTKAVDGANPLDFLQSLGLLVLCRVLFYHGWSPPARPAEAPHKKKNIPEEDRAAFLARIRSRLAEENVRSTGPWSSGAHE